MAMSKHVSPPLLRQQSTKVARELLQKVRDEGVSMQQLKEPCRYDLAIDLLADDGLTLDDIAQHVGFSDATTFSRGFKAWAGIAPSAYPSGLPSFA